MAYAAELRNFPEDDEEYAAPHTRASVENFPTTGMPLSYSSTAPLEGAENDAEFEGSIYDTSLYGEPTLSPPNLWDKAFAAVSSGIDACTPYVQASATKVRNVGKRVNELKEEQPLQMLGAIAGSAFVLGMVVRFWRSRS